MNDEVRAKLKELVATYGTELSADIRKVEGLLRDYCGEHKREISVLISSMKNRIPEEILNAKSDVIESFHSSRLIKRLYDNEGVDKDFAQWAVESWVVALDKETNISNTTSSTSDARERNQRDAESSGILKRSHIKTTIFRSTPLNYSSREEVRFMLKKNDFFDRDENKSGEGFSNSYELQNNSKVVCDHASGLMWQQTGSDKSVNYKDAKSYVAGLNIDTFAGYSNWRLPTLEEAMTLMESTFFHIDRIFNAEQLSLWTSDCFERNCTSRAWVVSFFNGFCNFSPFDLNFYVRAVR